MAARLDSAARYICEKSGWTVSNLKLQKLMYLAQMVYMGRTGGKRLFEGVFQAWDYGPVEPTLYQKVKPFGSGPVQNVFSDARNFKENDPKKAVLDDSCNRYLKFTPGDLVEITHWDRGAWASRYVPRARNTIIPDGPILDEYKARNPH